MSRSRLRITMVVVFAALAASACAYSPRVTPLAPAGVAFAATDADHVGFYASESAVPWEYLPVATIGARHTLRNFDAATLRPFREIAARQGADALVLDRMSSGRMQFLAVHLSTVPRRAAHAAVTGGAVEDSGATAGGTARGGCSGSCDVHVRGYTRKDGTYVHPHTRSRPGGGRRH